MRSNYRNSSTKKNIKSPNVRTVAEYECTSLLTRCMPWSAYKVSHTTFCIATKMVADEKVQHFLTITILPNLLNLNEALSIIKSMLIRCLFVGYVFATLTIEYLIWLTEANSKLFDSFLRCCSRSAQLTTNSQYCSRKHRQILLSLRDINVAKS